MFRMSSTVREYGETTVFDSMSSLSTGRMHVWCQDVDVQVLFSALILYVVGDVLGYSRDGAALLEFQPRAGCHGDPVSAGDQRCPCWSCVTDRQCWRETLKPFSRFLWLAQMWWRWWGSWPIATMRRDKWSHRLLKKWFKRWRHEWAGLTLALSETTKALKKRLKWNHYIQIKSMKVQALIYVVQYNIQV